MRKKIFDFCENKLSEEEKKEILDLIYSSEDAYRAYIEIKNFLVERKIANASINRKEINILLKGIHRELGVDTYPSVDGIKYLSGLKKVLLPLAAASVIFCIVLFGYTYIRDVKEQQAADYLSLVELKNEPGAVDLMLSDGEVVKLGGDNQSTNIAREQMKIVSAGNIINVENIAEKKAPSHSARPKRVTESDTVTERPLNYLTVNSKEDFMLKLPDGTQVWLRSKARFGFPEKFAHGERRVEIEGEGYFMVAPGKENPFIINANGTEVKVVGTEFNLRSEKESCELEISMTSGIVSVKGKKEEEILLTKDKQLIMNTGEGSYSITEIDSYKYRAWKEGYFVFINEDLPKILKTFSEWYGIEILLEGDRYNDNPFNGKFLRSSGLDKIIRTLQQSYDFHFYMKDRKLYIN